LIDFRNPVEGLGVRACEARNVFACGLGQSDAVLVFTRGLLEELDDDELAAVIAHELVHIRNGDLWLMAAAAVCQRSMSVLYNQGSWGGRKKQEAMSVGLSLLVMPVLFLVFVAVIVLRHSAIHFGYITGASRTRCTGSWT
jgi:Zn-dependent protease with chaperone function